MPLVTAMTRYSWANIDRQLELIDKIGNTVIARAFLGADRCWHWKRHTSPLLHGASFAEGRCKTQKEAKQAILAGLADGCQ